MAGFPKSFAFFTASIPRVASNVLSTPFSGGSEHVPAARPANSEEKRTAGLLAGDNANTMEKRIRQQFNLHSSIDSLPFIKELEALDKESLLNKLHELESHLSDAGEGKKDSAPALAIRKRANSFSGAISSMTTKEPVQFSATEKAARENPEDFLRADEAVAIYRYTKNSARINTAIRKGQVTDAIRNDIALIQSGLIKLGRAQGKQIRVIYRGIPHFKSRFKTYGEDGTEIVRPHPADQFKEGEPYVDPAFQSFSRSRTEAKQKATAMTKGEGTLVTALTEEGPDVSNISESPKEQEDLAEAAVPFVTKWKYYDHEEKLHQAFIVDMSLAKTLEEPDTKDEQDALPRRNSF